MTISDEPIDPGPIPRGGPFEDCLRKLDWAAKNNVALMKQADAWLSAHHDLLSTPWVKSYHPEEGYFEFRPPPLPEVPHHWPYLIGDIIHNFRCSLDYLAWRLVELGSKPDALKKKSAAMSIQFPIVWEPAEGGTTMTQRFEKSLSGRLPGVLLEAIALIRERQPYIESAAVKDPDDKPSPENCPFAVLARLSNKDKHRSHHITVAAMAGLAVDVEPTNVQHFEMDAGVETNLLVRFDGKVATIHPDSYIRVTGTPTGTGDPDLDYKATAIPAFVTADEGIAVLPALEAIGHHIAMLLLDMDELYRKGVGTLTRAAT